MPSSLQFDQFQANVFCFKININIPYLELSGKYLFSNSAILHLSSNLNSKSMSGLNSSLTNEPLLNISFKQSTLTSSV
ncbi:hypothetical protein BpHYR1_012927 [Brachionus plicatilis]|uniref:Uncharacterized protein n=1 Tax=Brachionus plicatilis TaxID=10195 RepID=A0A3M7P8C2_BRAPC|nr:hypothetical protein BpHYR1_012927 [Brachionus plicatilis]